MAAGDADEFRRPVVDYCDWPKQPENYILIRVDIPGLKKKFTSELPKNAEVTLELEERSFTLKVILTDAGPRTKKFRFHVNKLPDAILTEQTKSFWKVKRKDEVAVYLHKASPRCWDIQLKANGLDQEPSD